MIRFFGHCSIDQTRRFYQGLMKGENRRSIWGKENRFDADSITRRPSVLRNFVPMVGRYVVPNDKCLDLGCGTGGFLSLMSPMCQGITGADIVPLFVDECLSTIERKAITNASVVLLKGLELPFDDNEFDKVVMIDTIHHLEAPQTTMIEVKRVLKPGGHLLIFEPNKANPLLALMCVLDPNERGLLRLGTLATYRELLGNDFEIVCREFNGILVGPEGNLSVALADLVSDPRYPWLGWLSPKLFIVAKKRNEC